MSPDKAQRWEYFDQLPDRTRNIIRSCATAYGVQPTDILSSSRAKQTVAARHLSMVLLKQAGYSWPEIGKVLNKNHTTALKAIKRKRAKEAKEAEAKDEQPG